MRIQALFSARRSRKCLTHQEVRGCSRAQLRKEPAERKRPAERFEAAAKAAVDHGMRTVEVLVKGVGPGRESAVRSLQTAGLNITVINDITPIPHNGCRPPKRPRG